MVTLSSLCKNATTEPLRRREVLPEEVDGPRGSQRKRRILSCLALCPLCLCGNNQFSASPPDKLPLSRQCVLYAASMAKNIKARAQDYAQWYLDVIKAG